MAQLNSLTNRSQKSATALPMFRNAQLLTGIFPSMFLTPSCWEHFPIWGFLNDQRPGIKILPTWHWNGYIWPTTPNGKSRSYPADNNNEYLLRNHLLNRLICYCWMNRWWASMHSVKQISTRF